jgi:hypothetical protein
MVEAETTWQTPLTHWRPRTLISRVIKGVRSATTVRDRVNSRKAATGSGMVLG